MASALFAGLTTLAVQPWEAKDLNPVTVKPVPKQEASVLVRDGKALGKVYIFCPMTNSLGLAVQKLRECVKKATGADMEVITAQADKTTIVPPAIIIGDCREAASQGLEGAKMPPEGFEIKSAGGSVFIVGNRVEGCDGTAWGVYEFLERYLGVRWYFPDPEYGTTIPTAKDLIVPASHISDAPVFRQRELWPAISPDSDGRFLVPMHSFLRSANSWPAKLVVHSPNWGKVKEYCEKYPEVFQLKADKTRDYAMTCYGNPKTLELYLENVKQNYADPKWRANPENNDKLGVLGNFITVSPADAEVVCYCNDCRKLWDESAGQWGSASKIMSNFVSKLAAEVKNKWPDKTIIFLPYLNYSLAPEGFKFPNNVEVQLCGMPGMAMYAQPEVFSSEQKNIDKWVNLTGRKIQDWHYCCWPEDRTKAPLSYPHTVKKFYQANRDKSVGSFINGIKNHWPRQNITLYCWLKLLWNPDFDVDAALDSFCENAFGPAKAPMLELLKLQMAGWEDTVWPKGLISREAVFELSYPKDRVEKMKEQIAAARKLAAPNPEALRRLEYYVQPFSEFFQAADQYASGGGLKPLVSVKVGEKPKIDGNLDDAVWKRAEPVSFVRAMDRKIHETSYPTTVRSVWTPEGIVFGFDCSEPTPDLLETKNGGSDNPLMWWDDNIEIFLDVTGKNQGEYYQFMVNPSGNWFDSKARDLSWNAKGVEKAASVGKDRWSLEVFIPFTAFPEALKPSGGAEVHWSGNFTRHRVADKGQNSTKRQVDGSQREYQRMNTTYCDFSNNMEDFAPIVFREAN